MELRTHCWSVEEGNFVSVYYMLSPCSRSDRMQFSPLSLAGLYEGGGVIAVICPQVQPGILAQYLVGRCVILRAMGGSKVLGTGLVL